jgi:hypothetical protein
LAQTGSDRSPSIVGASEGSIRTILMLGRMKGGGESGPVPVPPAALLMSMSSEGAWPGAAGAAEAAGASASLPARTQRHAAAGAIAPPAFLLLCTPPPRGLCIVYRWSDSDRLGFASSITFAFLPGAVSRTP